MCQIDWAGLGRPRWCFSHLFCHLLLLSRAIHCGPPEPRACDELRVRMGCCRWDSVGLMHCVLSQPGLCGAEP